MTTFFYTTVSNQAAVNDVQAVAELLDEYYVTIDPSFDKQAGVISFTAEDSQNAFDVQKPTSESWVPREFLEELAPHLDDELEIKCVETQGTGEPAAWKWVLRENNEVEFVSL